MSDDSRSHKTKLIISLLIILPVMAGGFLSRRQLGRMQTGTPATEATLPEHVMSAPENREMHEVRTQMHLQEMARTGEVFAPLLSEFSINGRLPHSKHNAFLNSFARYWELTGQTGSYFMALHMKSFLDKGSLTPEERGMFEDLLSKIVEHQKEVRGRAGMPPLALRLTPSSPDSRRPGQSSPYRSSSPFHGLLPLDPVDVAPEDTEPQQQETPTDSFGHRPSQPFF